MSYGEQRRLNGDQLPLVGRPRGAAWRTLQADGVVWEGQVVLVGGDADLASRMIVTHRRVAFARGGAVVLDLARDWLRPAPILRRDGTILLSITPPGSPFGAEPETMALRMRDGHPAAGHVIAMLAGSGARRITPDAVPSSDYVRGLLPPLPDSRRPAAISRTEAEPVFPEFPLLPAGLDADLPFGSLELPKPEPALPPLSGTASPELMRDRDPVVRPSSPPSSMAHDRSWNLEPMRPVAPRSIRQRRRAWVLRLGGLVLLLGFSALLGAGRISLPNSAQPVADAPTATVPVVARYILPTAAAGVPSTVIADATSFAIGSGGGSAGQAVPPAAGAPASAAQATTEPTPVAEEEPTAGSPAEPTPAPATAEPTATEAAAVIASPAETAATPEPTTPTTPAPDAALSLQPAVDVARRGATLPEYGLTAPDEGEWVVVMVTVTNEGGDEAELAMTDFMLEAGDTMVEVDQRSTVVASILRLQGAPDEIDSAVSVDPGESITLPLVFRISADAAELTLRFGETSTDLAPFLTTASGVRRLS